MRRIGFLAALAVSGSAFGFGFDISGGVGGGIPDGFGGAGNDYGAPLVITMNVGTTGIITSLDLAGLNGLTHTWLGDLEVVLSHGGVSVDLMDRNYRTTQTGVGSGGDLSGNYMFNNTLNGVSGSAGAFGTGANAAGTYNRWDGSTGGGTSAAPGTFASFVGMALEGDWTITIRDGFAADVGSVQVENAMRIVGTANPVPEPATLAVLGIGAAALIRRRRK